MSWATRHNNVHTFVEERPDEVKDPAVESKGVRYHVIMIIMWQSGDARQVIQL